MSGRLQAWGSSEPRPSAPSQVHSAEGSPLGSPPVSNRSRPDEPLVVTARAKALYSPISASSPSGSQRISNRPFLDVGKSKEAGRPASCEYTASSRSSQTAIVPVSPVRTIVVGSRSEGPEGSTTGASNTEAEPKEARDYPRYRNRSLGLLYSGLTVCSVTLLVYSSCAEDWSSARQRLERMPVNGRLVMDSNYQLKVGLLHIWVWAREHEGADLNAFRWGNQVGSWDEPCCEVYSKYTEIGKAFNMARKKGMHEAVVATVETFKGPFGFGMGFEAAGQVTQFLVILGVGAAFFAWIFGTIFEAWAEGASMSAAAGIFACLSAVSWEGLKPQGYFLELGGELVELKPGSCMMSCLAGCVAALLAFVVGRALVRLERKYQLGMSKTKELAGQYKGLLE